MEQDKNKEVKNNDEIDLIELFMKLWSYRVFIIIFSSVAIILAVIYSLLATEIYDSKVTFYQVQNKQVPSSGIMSIASQFGFGGAGSAGSSYSIADLVSSRKMREQIIYHEWQTEEYDSLLNLIDFWELEGETPAEIKERALEIMNDKVAYDINEETGLQSITVSTREAQLSADIANYTIQKISEYIQNEQKTSTKENLEYIEKRLNTTKQELRVAEEALKEFREKNRMIAESPELQLEYGRLQREVTIKQEVYLTLQKEKEMAMIELVKETPVINILDEAVKPEKRSKPKRKLIVIIGAFAGFFLSIFSIIAHEVYKFIRARIKEYPNQ